RVREDLTARGLTSSRHLRFLVTRRLSAPLRKRLFGSSRSPDSVSSLYFAALRSTCHPAAAAGRDRIASPPSAERAIRRSRQVEGPPPTRIASEKGPPRPSLVSSSDAWRRTSSGLGDGH